ncbi:alpha/beta hydrolase [Streptomyces decoyicus]|uniref:alpha/beta hydrolase n=1 Tax=Streptomyces decoyicus TaxID=249567 RepID=UPI0031BA8909
MGRRPCWWRVPPGPCYGAPPVLVVNAKHDLAAPPAGARRRAQEFPEGRLAVVDRVGHRLYRKDPSGRLPVQAIDTCLLTLKTPPPGTAYPSNREADGRYLPAAGCDVPAPGHTGSGTRTVRCATREPDEDSDTRRNRSGGQHPEPCAERRGP